MTENNVRQALLTQQQSRQIEAVNHVAGQMQTDLQAIKKTLELLASHSRIQRGALTGSETTKLLENMHSELGEVSHASLVAILDANNILVNGSTEEVRELIGLDRSDQEYVIETRKRMQTYVSPAFTSALGEYIIAVSVPIVNEDTGEYLGMVVTAFPTVSFFESYGDFQASRIVAFDRNQVYVATTVLEFLGQEYWGEVVQTATRANPRLNAAYTTLFSGEPASTLFVSAVTSDERFVAGAPVFFQGEQVMSVAITTPTAGLYAAVEGVMFIQKIQTVLMLAAVVGAVSILIVFLAKWNKSLDAKVKERTAELEKANAQLEEHDKMQKEFINIAAHELRTPVQPLLGIADILDQELEKTGRIEFGRPEFEMLKRNARRLERLSSDILQVSRIESQRLSLQKEVVNLREKITNVVADAQSFIPDPANVRIAVEPFDENLTVIADKPKLFEVLSNLIRNAIKFTKEGTITIGVDVQKSEGAGMVSISVKDTGTGIDPQIMPRLFTKFVSRSESGTGLGLFISKSIVEAHGGKIWAENNKHGNGATFTFTIPASG
jgi:signal transduction histidine kinase